MLADSAGSPTQPIFHVPTRRSTPWGLQREHHHTKNVAVVQNQRGRHSASESILHGIWCLACQSSDSGGAVRARILQPPRQLPSMSTTEELQAQFEAAAEKIKVRSFGLMLSTLSDEANSCTCPAQSVALPRRSGSPPARTPVMTRSWCVRWCSASIFVRLPDSGSLVVGLGRCIKRPA